MSEAVVAFMAEARALGVIREVHGTAYPVSIGEMERWQEEQRKRQCQRQRSKKMGARFEWRKAFR